MNNVYLVLITAIALLLRIYDLTNNPIALNEDVITVDVELGNMVKITK
jgi:hypothetical protein